MPQTSLEHVTEKIDSILVQLEDPTLDKSVVRALFDELSLLFDEMIELRRVQETTALYRQKRDF